MKFKTSCAPTYNSVVNKVLSQLRNCFQKHKLSEKKA